MVAVLFPCMFFMLACQDQIIAQQEKARPAQLSGNNQVFLEVEEAPSYSGGYEKMSEIISQNMRYPEKARKEKIEGTVYVSFIVEKDGTVGDATVIKGVESSCDEEALRVTKLLNSWQPGKQNGKSSESPICFACQIQTIRGELSGR